MSSFAPEIVFLSGMTRAHDWALGAFTQQGNLGEVFVQAQVGPLLQGSLAFSLRTEGRALAATRSKPKSREESVVGVPSPSPGRPMLAADDAGSSTPDGRAPSMEGSRSTLSLGSKKDQCLFVHFYKVRKRFWISRQVFSAAAGFFSFMNGARTMG